MAHCSRCRNQIDLDTRKHLEIPNVGIFCSDCTQDLAKEGREQVRVDRLTLGDDVVNERLKHLKNELDNPTVRH